MITLKERSSISRSVGHADSDHLVHRRFPLKSSSIGGERGLPLHASVGHEEVERPGRYQSTVSRDLEAHFCAHQVTREPRIVVRRYAQ
jgi:hypothetical protein